MPSTRRIRRREKLFVLFLQAGVNKIGVAIDRIELKQIGLPRDMQRNMASEAEAKVQARAKLVASEGESRANNRLVEAGDSLDVVSIHLRSVTNIVHIFLKSELSWTIRIVVCGSISDWIRA